MTGGGTAGFSLVELLLVVAAMSILTVGVGLTIGRRGPAEPSDAAALVRLDAAARSDALMRREARALIVTATGLGRGRRQSGAWQDGGEIRRWQGSASWTLPKTLETPVIAYLPDGRSTPFDVVFRDGASAIRCVSDGWTAPQCAPP